MKKILIALCFSLVFSITKAGTPEGIEVVGVIDGDTLRAVIPSLPDPLHHVSIRIMGIDTPELRAKCPKEKLNAKKAKEFLTSMYQKTKSITLKNYTWDKYGGRILSEVYFDEVDVSKVLLEQQLAVPYDGSKKQSFCPGDSLLNVIVK